MSIIVGREGGQNFSIDNAGVSRQHVRIEELGNDQFLLEDLNSSNGTFVNNERIIRRTVSRSDLIRLGPSYQLKLAWLFPVSTQKQPASNPLQSTPTDKKTATQQEVSIHHLRAVRERYEKEKIAIMKEAATAQVKRMLPPILVSALLLLTTLFLDGETAGIIKPILSVVSVALIAYSTYRYYQIQTERPARLESIKKELQIKYVCPHCGGFLGDIPFENIQNQGKCSKCKTKWK